MNTLVLVTGGGGFIGSHIVDRLVKEGHRVRILDNFSTGKEENIAHIVEKIEIIRGDILDLKTCLKATQGVDIVLHQAALPSVQRSIKDPLTTFQVNALGTLNLLIASKDNKVKRFVYASSSSVYGDNPMLPKREDMLPSPLSPYAVSKLVGEMLCKSFHKTYGLSTVSLRYFNVFGPRQDPYSPYAAVVPCFISNLLRNKRPTIYGDGEQTRDFTYVDNVVEANVLSAFATGIDGEVFNIAYGQPTSVNKLFEIIRELTGKTLEPIYAEPRLGEVKHSWADISKAREKLGYTPKINILEGLKKTVDFFARIINY
jgi:nucleoside-diphosphate-sugar epimerase